MDLGGRGSLGICSVPLRPMGRLRPLLGMGARTVLGPALLRSGAGGLVWRAALWHWHKLWLRYWLWRRIWLVSAGLWRAVLPVVRGQSRLFPQRKHQQHAD